MAKNARGVSREQALQPVVADVRACIHCWACCGSLQWPRVC
ncbi:hypothetical protein [Streptomyces sp. NPDC102437]